MKSWVYWLAWIVWYGVGYATIHWLHDGPTWAATIGGWVVAWGIMGRYREVR